jgi:manganese-dependent ADP-ribose/CDP-alcohol diphosphatase
MDAASNQRPRRSRRIEASLVSSTEPERPLFTMGLLADIQYAPIDDGHSYSGIPRYYRHALTAAQHAAQHFQEEHVDLVVNLGDLVDGKCNQDHAAVDDVIKALSVYQGPILHTYGNHCLYNMDRTTISTKLGIPFVKEPCGDLVGYYSHIINNIRFIVLDSYDVAMMQRCEKTSQKRKEAVQLLQRHNSENFAAGLENSPEGLVGVQKRFVAFNGAVGEVQLQWLQSQLEAARRGNEKVIVLSHQPILPGSTNPVCLMWNYKEVLAVLRDYKDVVVASFAGHAHKGGYQRDVSGIHFRVFEAVLENPDPHKTYAVIKVYEDRLKIKGYGNCSSAVYKFDHQPL